MKQSFIILSSIILGIFLPELSHFSYFIPYLLGVMLFFSFVQTKISFDIFTEKRVYFIFAANIFIGWAAYFCVLPFAGQEIAFIAFCIGMIPTALAAPAVVSVLKGNISFTLGAVLLTNFGIGLLFPFFSSLINPIEVSSLEMMIKIFTLLSIPFVTAEIVKKFFPTIQKKVKKSSFIVFYIWASIIVLAITTASQFLRDNWEQYSYAIIPIAIISAVICLLNFTIGHFIGGKKFSIEASQSLGQKNVMLMVWIGLQFFSPLVALGPTFYILFHNLVNAWKMMKK